MTTQKSSSGGRQSRETQSDTPAETNGGLSGQKLVAFSLIGVFAIFGLYYFIPAIQKGPDHVHSRDDAPKNNQASQQQEAPRASIQEEIAQLENHLQHEPEDYSSLRHLGHLYLESRQHAKAVDIFRKAALVNPHSPEAYVELGIALRRNDQPDKAEEVLLQMTKSVPDYGEAWLQLAITYRFGLKDNEKALKNFEQFLALEGESPVAMQVRQEIEAIKSELGK